MDGPEIAAYVPRFLDGSPLTPGDDDVYVRVRVSNRSWPTGSVTAFLLDGTALVVPAHDLVRLAPAGDAQQVR